MSNFGRFAFLGGRKRDKWWERPIRPKKSKNPYTGKLYFSKVFQKRKTNKLHQTRFSTRMDEDSWFGDEVTGIPDKKVTRIMLMNCHGLPYTDMIFFKSFLTMILQQYVHYFGLPEININTHNQDLNTSIMSATEQVMPGGYFHMTNSRVFDSQISKQPGGVAAGFHGRISSKFSKVIYDKLGRWVVHQFNGSKKNLKIYTLYRVNPRPYRSKNTTAWDQQHLLLREKGIQMDPRKQVILDLLKDLKESINAGFSIILMADLNEPIGGNEKTNEQLAELGLLNIFQRRFGTLPNTHVNGTQAIDHIWATQDVETKIARAGYAPFRYISNTDHRPLLLDLDLHKFLEKEDIVIFQPSARRLKSSTPKRVSKYNAVVKKSWDFHKMSKKWEECKEMLYTEGVTKDSADWVNRIDGQISDIMREGEKKSTSMNKPITQAWSDKLHDAVRNIYEWAYRKRMALRTTVEGIFDENKLKECLDGCADARNEYRTVLANADEHRDTMNEEKAKAAKQREGQSHVSDKKYIQIIQHREKQRIDAIKMNRVLGRNMKGSVTKLLIPAGEEYEGPVDIYNVQNIWRRVQTDDGRDIKTWITVVDRDTIEHLLLDWQRIHFEQASETPFSSKEWRHHLEEDETQHNILSGRYKKKFDIPDESVCLLQFMKKRTDRVISSAMKFAEFVDFYRKAKETTSSSPSGRHYGHYKALIDGNMEVMRVIFDILTVCLEKGIILERWKNSVTSLIEKIEGKPYLHKFRTIHVVESELQYFSKVIYARRMMKLVEKENIVTDDQYGGRTRRQATSAILNKLMYYSICRQLHMPCAFMDDDAKACYDRVIPNLAEVESRKWGVPYKLAKYTTSILKQQKFHVKTGFGISKQFYSFEDNNPIFGVGQGLGWSGPIWLNSADTISQLMNSKCAGMKFVSKDGKIVICKKGDFFVDDTSTGVTGNCLFLRNTVLQQLQHDEQWHAFALYSAGHKLALHKCSYYLIEFKRKGTNYVCKMNEEFPGDLYLREGFQAEETLVPRLEPDQPHKTLGHWISITENYTKQIETISAKIDSWINKVCPSTLSGEDRIKAYNTYLLPSIKYKILSTNMTYEEGERLGIKLAPVLLHAFGINKNCSRNLLYQPHHRLGLQVHHLYHVKGLEKLKIVLMHLRSNDTTAHLLKIALGYTTMECGSLKSCLELSYMKYKKYITHTWLTDLWKYMHECKSSIIVENLENYKMPRTNDFMLMDLVESSTIQDHNKAIFNQVRLWMQVATASDIVVMDRGSDILPAVWHCARTRTSSWNWPEQESPPPAWKRIWQSVLRSVILPALRDKPLREWIQVSHQKWTTFANPHRTQVCIEGVSHSYTKVIGGESEHPHLCLCPIDVWQGKIIGMQVNMQRHISMSTPSPSVHPHTLEESLSNVKGWRKQTLGQIPTMKQMLTIKQCIIEGKCIAAGDGSLRHKYPGQAWCFANTQKQIIICRGAANVEGPAHEITSIRAEGFAVLAQLIVLELLETAYDFKGKHLRILSDCASLITKINTGVEYSTKYALHDDIDVILQIRHMLRRLQCNIQVEYVRSHRDRVMHFEDAPFYTQLNILMDEHVRKHIDNQVTIVPRINQYPVLDNTRVSIRCNHSALVHDIENSLISNYMTKKWKPYLKTKFNLDLQREKEIRSDILGKVLKRQKFNKGQVTKILHNQHHTLCKSKLWKLSTHDKCPLCQAVADTSDHFLLCRDETMIQIRRNRMVEFNEFLEKQHTDPGLHQFIGMIITDWMQPEVLQRKFNKLGLHGEVWKELWASQQSIGWRNGSRGLLSSKMIDIQQQSYNDNKVGPSFTGEVWYQRVIGKLWNFLQTCWQKRCELVHKDNEQEAEKLFRAEVLEFFRKIRRKAWCFTANDQWLLRKSEKFFEQANYQSLNTWRRQVEAAMNTARFQAIQQNRDIRGFFPLTAKGQIPHRKKSRANNQPLLPTQIIYRQLKLVVERRMTGNAKNDSNDHDYDRGWQKNDFSTDALGKRIVLGYTPGEKEREWIGKVKQRRRLRQVEIIPKNNSMCNNNFKRPSESIHSVVSPVVDTRKIKNCY